MGKGQVLEIKFCGKCKQDLPIDSFSWKNKSKGTRSSYCKECNRVYNRSHYVANKSAYTSKARAYEKSNGGKRFITYKLTEEDYTRLLSKYNGLCWVCKKNKASVVDHDHSCCSGAKSCGSCVRGVLCLKCNTGLGLLQDSPEVLTNALEYLQSNNMSL